MGSSNVKEAEPKKKRITLLDAVPDIEKYWDYEKNDGKLPTDFSRTAGDKVYTHCPICGTSVRRNVRYTWEADENGVGHVIHCRTCGKRNNENALVVLFPQIKEYWVYDKNEHDPEYYPVSSGKRVLLRCPECGKERDVAISDAVSRGADGKYRLATCPECGKEKGHEKRRLGNNNILKCCPDVHQYWDERNEVSPDKITINADKRLYTHCPTCNKLVLRWAANTFVLRDGVYHVRDCQQCAVEKANLKKGLSQSGPLIEECPEIEEWWDFGKNKKGIGEITRGTHYEAYLKCPACDNEIQKDIHSFVAMHRDGRLLPVACPNCGYSSKGDPEDNLLKLCPEIEDWWDYEKNDPYTPEQFTKGSQYFAYLKCPDCGLELYSGIHSLLHTDENGKVVISHSGRCRKYKAMESDNNILMRYPDVKQWWDYEKNEGLPEEYTLFSPLQAYFKCPTCGAESHRRITDAFFIGMDGEPNLFKCPYCTGMWPIRGVNSLAAVYPELAAQCISTDDPERIFATSTSRMEWKCPDCGQTWFDLVSNRTEGSGCPYCENRRVLPGLNSLKDVKPVLAAEWSKNNEKDADQFLPTLSLDVLWICPTCHGEYSYPIRDREVGDDACPYCAGRKALAGYNSLKDIKPALAMEWSVHNERNADQVLPTMSVYALWVCPTCHGEYSYPIRDREVGDDACPYCAGRKVLPGYNSILAKYPDLIKTEWAENENTLIDEDPDQLLETYSKEVWWNCPKCGDTYPLPVNKRIRKYKRGHNPCYMCNGRRWSKCFNI